MRLISRRKRIPQRIGELEPTSLGGQEQLGADEVGIAIHVGDSQPDPRVLVVGALVGQRPPDLQDAAPRAIEALDVHAVAVDERDETVET